MFVGYVLWPEHVPSLLFVDSQFETEEKNKSKKKGGERSWGKDLINRRKGSRKDHVGDDVGDV